MSGSQTASERNLQDMKRKILEQIDRTIQESPPRGGGTRTGHNLYGSSSVMSTGVSPMIVAPDTTSRRFNTNASESEDENTNYQTTTNAAAAAAAHNELSQSAANMSKNLRVLKSQILEKERAQDASVSKLKNKSYAMNDDIENMRSKIVVMQDTLKSRDRTIMDLGSQLSDTRIFAGQQSRENVLEKTQEEMHNTILHLRNKLSMRKAQISEIKEGMNRTDSLFAEEKRRLMEDRLVLERNFEVLREKFEEERFRCNETEKLLEKARFELQNRDIARDRHASESIDTSMFELSTRLTREQEFGRELRAQNAMQEKKIVDQERQLLVLDEKLQKSKKKFEEEKAIAAGERKKETEKRKLKNRKLKVELKSLEEKANELAGDGAELRSEKDRLNRTLHSLQQEIALKNAEVTQLKETITGLRDDVDVLKHSVRDGDLLLKREQQEFKKLEKELKGATSVLQERDEKLGEYEFQLQKERESYGNLELELHRQIEVNRSQQDLILKIERQNQFLTDMQNRDIDKLEERVTNVNVESSNLRYENDALLHENVALKSELQSLERDGAAIKDKAKKYKHQVSILKHSLAEADEKLRELIYQKHTQIRNATSRGSGAYGGDDDDEEEDDDYDQEQNQHADHHY